jgi:serine/threonine protein kinase
MENPIQPGVGAILRTEQDAYRVVAPLSGQGKHGISFKGEASNGDAVFIKAMKIPPAIAWQDVKGRVDRLSQNFRAEHQHAERLKDVGSIAHVLDHGTYDVKIGNDTLEIPFLVQEFIDGLSLDEYLVKCFGSDGRFNGIDRVKDWIALALSMLITLRRVHDREIVHGDIHPGNFLVVGHEPILIDFGQSLIRDVEQYGIETPLYENDFTPPEKWHPQPGPWEQPSDVFALGMTLLYMAIGETITRGTMQTIHKPSDLRDDVLKKFQMFNQGLRNQNTCLPHFFIQALHKNPHERPTCRQLVTFLRSIARLSDIPHSVPLTDIREKLESLEAHINDESSTQDDVITSLLDNTVSRFRRKVIQAVRHKRIEVSGDRNEIISCLLLFLSHMKRGDTYWSLTHPTFWRPYNLGRKGRFYEFNAALALKGVGIRRLFVYGRNEPEEAIQFAKHVLADHRQLCVDLRALEIYPPVTLREAGGMYTGVLIADDFSTVQQLVAAGYLIGIAQIGGTNYSLSFSSETEENVIRRMTVEHANKYKALSRIDKFCDEAKKAISILEFDTEQAFTRIR